jgi:hypothetical protein
VTQRRITIGILIAFVALLIGYDIYAYVSVPRGEATISDVVLTFAQQHPVLPFLLGVVAGHLCWPQESKR